MPVNSGSAFPVATMATATTPRMTAQVRTNLNRNASRADRWAFRICPRIGGSTSGAASVTLVAITPSFRIPGRRDTGTSRDVPVPETRGRGLYCLVVRSCPSNHFLLNAVSVPSACMSLTIWSSAACSSACGRAGLVGRHRERLVEDRVADGDHRRAVLDGLCDRRGRAQPAIEVLAAGLDRQRAVDVGLEGGGLHPGRDRRAARIRRRASASPLIHWK